MTTTTSTNDTDTSPVENPRKYLNYIGGEWRASASGETIRQHQSRPHQRDRGRFQRSTAADIDAAIAAAEQALPAWRKMPAPQRGEIILRAALLLEERREELARADDA